MLLNILEILVFILSYGILGLRLKLYTFLQHDTSRPQFMLSLVAAELFLDVPRRTLSVWVELVSVLAIVLVVEFL